MTTDPAINDPDITDPDITDPDITDPGNRTEYRIVRELQVDATPDQVWDAIATAEGISRWLVPTRLDERTGGQVTFDFGTLVSEGIITDYTRPTRFAYAEGWPAAEGMPSADKDLGELSPIATEFLVEATSGGTCVVRVVTSAFGTGADWEQEFFDEMSDGWGKLLDGLPAHIEARPAA